MDENVNIVLKKRAERVIQALKSNNINGYFAETGEEVVQIVQSLIAPGDIIASGGSVTLTETGVIGLLRNKSYDFLDRQAGNLTAEEARAIYIGAFSADAYFTGINAITEAGEIYNVDGNGNRIAAITFGPKKVIFIAGVNKIVKNLDDAIERNKAVAAPANTIRLEKKTPCARLGYCVDCNSEDRICNKYSLIKKEREKDRMHVILVNQSLGY